MSVDHDPHIPKLTTVELSIGDAAPVPPEPDPEQLIMANWNDNSTQVLVTIVCHAYNHVNFVNNALNGILMQKTDFAFEIIVHDDASIDGTSDIVRQYERKYPKIIYPIFQNDNQYSRGFKPSEFTFPKAKGKFIAFCEGDDYWLDDRKLQKQADFLKSNEAYAVCSHDACIVENERLVQFSKLNPTYKRDFTAKQLQRGIHILPVTAMFVNKLQMMPPEQRMAINGDNFIFSRLGAFGGSKYLGDIIPCVYRRHEGGIWSSRNRQDQIANSINTKYWMMQYYKRTDNPELSGHFGMKSLRYIFEEIPRSLFHTWLQSNVLILRILLQRLLSIIKRS